MRTSIFTLNGPAGARRVAAAAICACIGFTAWNSVETECFLALLPAFIFIWARANSRVTAGLYALSYYLAASHCLFEIGKNFWGIDSWSPVRGTAIWFGTSLVLATVWGLCWSPRRRGLRAITAILLTTLPPIGIIGWTSPLSALGILFPGTGWIGLVLTLGLFAAVSRQIVHWPMLAILGTVSIAANICAPRIEDPGTNIIPVTSRLGNTAASGSEFDRVRYIERTTRRILRNAPDHSIVVFPETILTSWEVAGEYLGDVGRQAEEKGIMVLVGAQLHRPDGEIVNGLFEPGSPDPVAASRIAVPLGFWRPWSEESTKINWRGTGTTTLQGRPIGFLICYEQLINWPIAMTFLAKPEALIGPGNVWFGDESNVEDIKRLNTKSWAKLFSVPVFFATNHR